VHVCVCIHVCICVCACMYVCVCVYVCMYVRTIHHITKGLLIQFQLHIRQLLSSLRVQIERHFVSTGFQFRQILGTNCKFITSAQMQYLLFVAETCALHTHTHTNTYAHTHAHTHTHTQHTHTHTHTHTYTHTCTHTHTPNDTML